MIDIEEISKEALSLITQQKAFENNILPLKIEGKSFYVGLSNINNLRIINDLSFDTGLKIIPKELSSEFILMKLKELYPENNIEDKKQPSNGNNQIISESSNIDFVNEIIYNAINHKASDIHLEIYENYFRVRYRIDGHLREILNNPLNKSLSILSRIKIMANLDISEKRRPQDGRIRLNFNNKNIDIRVSTLPTNFGEKIVLRILDKSQLNLNLKLLGLNNSEYSILLRNLHHPYGMILVTGPTGSGKTTTLYSALNEINSIEKNILTIEDPIEYNLSGINQSNVKPDIGFTFANALRSFLRQDPDIIMVGEIRDKETAEIAIRASLTGHLVFSTLHTNDSISAISRLVDMGVESFLIASSVKLIIAQRLVRKLCECKIIDDRKSIKDIFKERRVFSHKGCGKCSNTGYKGRVGLFEILEITDDLAELISVSSSKKEIMDVMTKKGFRTLKDSGIENIKKGITSYDEVLRETI